MRSQSEAAVPGFRRNGRVEWGTPFEWEAFHFEAELAPDMRLAAPANPFSEAEALELVGELFEIDDKEELDLFLGKLAKKVGRATRGAVRAVQKTVRSLPLGKIANLALNVARGNLVGVLLPLLPASMQKTVRALTADPFTRFALQATKAALRGDNILRAVQVAAKSGIGDLRERMRFAAMVAPFVPGIGSGVAAALGAASALAAGEPLSKALIAAARSAVPGGAIAQAAFDLGSNLAQGKSLSEAALATARNQIPGGPAARAAFDAAVAIGQGKKIQDAAFAAAGRVLPKSPFAADALSFARRVAAGENIGKAALSTAGNAVVKRLERQGVNLLGKAQRQVPRLATLRREVPNIGRPEFARWVQRSLNQLMSARLIVDGVMGAGTRAAVRAFQQAQGLTPDGVVGPQTAQRLQRLLGGGAVLSSSVCGLLRQGGVVLDRFGFDRIELHPFHQEPIERMAQCIAGSQRTRQPIRALRIVGHTDPVGPGAYNVTLGQRRAERVRNRMVEHLNRLSPGLPARMLIAVESRGESQPIPGDAARSRRVVVRAVATTPPARGCLPSHTSRVRLHLKILVPPTRFSIATMLASMRQVYGPAGIFVEVASQETLRLPQLEELDLFCPGNPNQTCCPFPCGTRTLNAEHVALFQHRNQVGPNDVAVYFVRTTVPGLNGCCAHPPGRPGVVVTANASQWTLGHEVGHVLGLPHVNSSDRLMTGGGTNNLTHPPPDLVPTEIGTMQRSHLTIPC